MTKDLQGKIGLLGRYTMQLLHLSWQPPPTTPADEQVQPGHSHTHQEGSDGDDTNTSDNQQFLRHNNMNKSRQGMNNLITGTASSAVQANRYMVISTHGASRTMHMQHFAHCTLASQGRVAMDTTHNLTTATSGTNASIAGSNPSQCRTHRYTMTLVDTFTVQLPLLHGSRCYTDSSTVPDSVSSCGGTTQFNIIPSVPISHLILSTQEISWTR